MPLPLAENTRNSKVQRQKHTYKYKNKQIKTKLNTRKEKRGFTWKKKKKEKISHELMQCLPPPPAMELELEFTKSKRLEQDHFIYTVVFGFEILDLSHLKPSTYHHTTRVLNISQSTLCLVRPIIVIIHINTLKFKMLQFSQ